jgi:histidinol dehydrogenase
MIDIPIVRTSRPRELAAFRRALQKRRTPRRGVAREVDRILEAVRARGDRALFAYAKKFDGVALTSRSVRLDPASFPRLAKNVSPALGRSIRQAARRIRAYHRKQGGRAFTLRTAEGVLSQQVRPLDRVGLYVPGGVTVYPSTVLMNVIPAKLAGVREIAVATPCKGGLDPILAFVFDLLGITEVYRIGGAQAIAALAYGTRSVRQVDKIVGPGNTYVSLAKKAVYGTVDIDMVAGPSEVVVMADRSVDPRWVALDLLAQAEHGTGDEMAVCLTESMAVAGKVRQSLEREMAGSDARGALGRLGPYAVCICVTRNRESSIELVNDLAPEHLQIMTRTCRKDVRKVRNAAAVFLGRFTPVALGDYYIGTNHVLPTGRAARYASPLGVESFVKCVSVAEVTRAGLGRAAGHVSRLARAEKFVYHALSVERRVGR